MNNIEEIQRGSHWYFGGLASAGASCFTHPIDLIKANLQTQQGRLRIMPLTGRIVRNYGIFGLYNGFSAALLRQATYSVTRFGAYEVGKDYIDTRTFNGKVALASSAGFVGGLVGSPWELVNVRMQNDMKLSRVRQRNYMNALNGVLRVSRHEGFRGLFSGAITTATRCALMTVGQIAFYEQGKEYLLKLPQFENNLSTHVMASIYAGLVATIITQPLDVIKTRMMNASRGQYKGFFDVISFTSHLGPLGFFKGLIPAAVRVVPQTVLTFVFLEQLKMRFDQKSENS